MFRSIVKTVINAVWVLLEGLILCQVLHPSKAIGYILIIVYFVVLLIFRPMNSLYKASIKPDINIPSERQVPNKIYSIVLLSVKVLLLVTCLGIVISGAVLYRIIFLKILAMKLHLIFSYWAIVLSAIQLGINICIIFISKYNNMILKMLLFISYIGSVIGIYGFITTGFGKSLIMLSEKLIEISAIQVGTILLGCVSLGFVGNFYIRKIFGINV